VVKTEEENLEMTNRTQKFSQLVSSAAMRVIALALFVVVFGVGAVLAQTRAYVTNFNSDSVSVIDPVTNTVVATIPVTRPQRIAVTPDGAFAYATSTNTLSISVISAATNTVIATIPDAGSPGYIAITPSGAFAYVVNNNGTVSVIATATNTITATLSSVGPGPSGLAITPDGAFVYIAVTGAGTS
jgi:YVTN family beta-propeller protein